MIFEGIIGLMIIANRSPYIVVVDDFLDQPWESRAKALADNLEFHPDIHKGRRGTQHPIEPALGDYLASLFGKQHVTDGYCVFQVCIAGEELVYHADDNDYAAVIYLTPEAPVASGTSFFKSKATGARSKKDIPDLETASLTFDGKLLDRTAWEEVDRFGNVFNRLAAWNARYIHAATDYFGHSPDTGRLFYMAFFNAQ